MWISAPQWWDRKCEGRNEKCDFLARESVNSQQLCEFLAWESVNSSPILARQWWRHFRLSLFLSLYYRKRGSASYIVREVLSVCERERERERDTERQRRKWRHHCRAKIGENHTFPCQKFTIGDELTLSLAKNSHFSFLPSHFPSLPSRRGLPLWRWKSQWVHTFHCQNFFRPLCSPSFKWHEPCDEWSKTQGKWSNPTQSYFDIFVLPIEKMNQINTKNYWK